MQDERRRLLIARSPVMAAQVAVHGKHELGRGQHQPDRHLGSGGNVIVDTVQRDLRIVAQQLDGLLGRTGEGRDDGAQMGAGLHLFLGREAGHQDMEITRGGHIVGAGDLDGRREEVAQGVDAGMANARKDMDFESHGTHVFLGASSTGREMGPLTKRSQGRRGVAVRQRYGKILRGWGIKDNSPHAPS